MRQTAPITQAGSELSRHRSAFRVVLTYAVFAALWILFSDKAVEALFSEPDQIIRASMLKGWLFVVVTTLLLYILVRQLVSRLDAAQRREQELVVARDASERDQREDALRRQRDLIQHYLDTMQTLVVALDADGRITMINRAGCALLGRSAGELLGQSWFDTCLPQPEGREQVFPIFQAIMAGRLAEHAYTENVVLYRDGSQRLIAWHNNHLLDAAGKVIGTLSSGEDITERRQAEDELKARYAELERFNRVSIGRELNMIELKKQVNALARELGRAPPYRNLDEIAVPEDGAPRQP